MERGMPGSYVKDYNLLEWPGMEKVTPGSYVKDNDLLE